MLYTLVVYYGGYFVHLPVKSYTSNTKRVYNDVDMENFTVEELKVSLGEIMGEFDSLYYCKDGIGVCNGISLLLDAKCCRVRQKALTAVEERMKQHYADLRKFGGEILSSNKNNTVKICTTRLQEGDEPRFQRMYICYDALKKAWKEECRPVLGLDGCFLKTVCGGQLLSVDLQSTEVATGEAEMMEEAMREVELVSEHADDEPPQPKRGRKQKKDLHLDDIEASFKEQEKQKQKSNMKFMPTPSLKHCNVGTGNTPPASTPPVSTSEKMKPLSQLGSSNGPLTRTKAASVSKPVKPFAAPRKKK